MDQTDQALHCSEDQGITKDQVPTLWNLAIPPTVKDLWSRTVPAIGVTGQPYSIHLILLTCLVG